MRHDCRSSVQCERSLRHDPGRYLGSIDRSGEQALYGNQAILLVEKGDLKVLANLSA